MENKSIVKKFIFFFYSLSKISFVESSYIHNFVYPSSGQAVSFNGNGPVYFAHPPPPTSQTHFHQYNSSRQQFHLSPFQTSSMFQSPHPQTISTSNENSSTDLSSRFRHLKTSEQRPISSDFERLHNSHQSSRFQFRPQSFYDFSRSSNNNNNRYQRNNNTNPSLPLSAYMNTDDSFKTRRRLTQQRSYHQDKHQFPLSSYDPRQYGFNNNLQKRNDINNWQSMNNNDGNIDLIEEWWEDNNTELIGTDSKTTTVDDSGNSSLSTSMNLKDEFVNPPSDDSMLFVLEKKISFFKDIFQVILSNHLINFNNNLN
jgi:hypothetical protein